MWLLLQAAWEEVEQSLVELAQTRSRVQQLKNQLQTRKKDAELEVSSIRDELQDDSLALWVHSNSLSAFAVHFMFFAVQTATVIVVFIWTIQCF